MVKAAPVGHQTRHTAFGAALGSCPSGLCPSKDELQFSVSSIRAVGKVFETEKAVQEVDGFFIHSSGLAEECCSARRLRRLGEAAWGGSGLREGGKS